MSIDAAFTYALTGSLEELEDLKAKLEEADKRAPLLPNGKRGNTEFGDLIELLGGDRKEAGEYRCWIDYWGDPDWDEIDPGDEDFDFENWINQYHRIDKNKYGEYYIMISFAGRWQENPKMRNIFTNAYKSLRIFVEWGSKTNDEEYRFFKRDTYLPYLCDDGLHYRLLDNGEAHLYADSLIEGDEYRIPTTTTHNGKTYNVVGVYSGVSEEGDLYGYGSTKKIKVLYVPEQIQFISADSFSYSELEKVVFEGDINLGYCSFANCEKLAEVVLKGKNNNIDSHAFEDSQCADSIPYNEA